MKNKIYFRIGRAYFAVTSKTVIEIRNGSVNHYGWKQLSNEIIDAIFSGVSITKEECEAAFNKVVQNLKEKI